MQHDSEQDASGGPHGVGLLAHRSLRLNGSGPRCRWSGSIAFDPAGAWWLMTIERDTMDHRGGQHVTQVRPPAASSREIHHDGRIRRVHARHVLASTSSFRCRSRLRARARSVLRDSGSRRKAAEGRTLALPGDTPMRAVVTGSARRHVLAVIVHDAAQPATMRMEEGAGPKLAACK